MIYWNRYSWHLGGSDYLFKREHHIRVATILQALDAELLAKHHCRFGGGTAIVLSHGEYRESMDIDFLVSDQKGYRNLRELMTSAQGIQAIARAGTGLTSVRDVRADQYGFRTMLKVGDAEIKIEIVHEGRIELEAPGPDDRICGVTTLTCLDMATSKLLANSDRGSDDSTFSRDLIDLAMLELPSEVLNRAKEKACTPYGTSIENALAYSIASLKKRKGRLDVCMEALKMNEVPKAQLWGRIRNLTKKRK